MTIDEQIKHQQNTVKIIEDFDDKESLPKEQAILASLDRLKKIDAVQVPEGELIPECSYCGLTQAVTLKSYDTLRDLLKRESADAKHYREKSDLLSDAAFHSEERAEAAEATIAAMLKLGENPSEEMMEIYIALFVSEARFDGAKVFKAMFAKLAEQAGVKK